MTIEKPLAANVLAPILRRALVAVILTLAILVFDAASKPSVASACPPPGGDPISFPSAAQRDDFAFVGKGWGHGVGMSQYGARGAAILGCSAETIVTTYYKNTSVGSSNASSNQIRVGLIPNAPRTANSSDYFPEPATSVNVENASNTSIPWRLSGSSSHPPDQAAGRLWQVQVLSSGQYRLRERVGSSWQTVWQGGGWDQPLNAHLGSGRILNIPGKGIRYNRGQIEFRSRAFTSQPRVYVTAVLPSIEQYLYGLAEMPSSFPHQSLRAQAIVGRSFAVVRRQAGSKDNCFCHLYDSVFDQVYRAFEKESEGTNASWGRLWVEAVDSSAQQVVLSGGSVVSGNYASSHGGHSDSAAFVWGGSGATHLQPVDDSRWERASGNPHMQWTARFSREELGRRFGVGTALRVRLPDPKGTSGRIGDPAAGYGGFIIEGTEGSRAVSGNAARTTLGLRSALFRVVNPPLMPAGAIPVTGDWNGDGVTNIGWFHEGQWMLRRTNGSVVTFLYGQQPGDVPVTGDWNADRHHGVGIFREGTWALRNSLVGERGHTYAVIDFR